VPWDQEEEVRQMAISVAGEDLRDQTHPELLRELLRLFGDEHQRQLRREDAYLALGRAMGRAWRELPSAARPFDLHDDIDPAVIAAARQRLLAETGGQG
jgi:hypothetical protein